MKDYDWDKLAGYYHADERWKEFCRQYESDRKRPQREDESRSEYMSSEGDRWQEDYENYKRHLYDLPKNFKYDNKKDPEVFKKNWHRLCEYVENEGLCKKCLITEKEMLAKYHKMQTCQDEIRFRLERNKTEASKEEKGKDE